MLVKDIDTLKNYLPVDLTTKVKSINPAFEIVERNFIVKILGQPLYELLHQAVTNNSETADQKELLAKIMPVLAPLAYHTSLASLSTRFSDSGFFTSSSPDKERLPKWHFEELKLELLTNGYNAIEPLFQYLLTSTVKDWITPWSKADFLAEFQSLFIRSAKEFSSHQDINNSTWLFLRLKGHIEISEQLYIRGEIGIDFYNNLKAKLVTGLSPEEKALLPYIQKPLALLAYASAIRDPKFIEEMRNLSLIRKDSSASSSEVDMAKYYGNLAMDLEAKAQSLLGLLSDELNTKASASVFTIFFNSKKYKGVIASTPTSSYNNATSEGTFFM